jgi:hypothetical protein
VLQQLAADSQFDAERMWIRGPHLWYDRRCKGAKVSKLFPNDHIEVDI